VRAAALLVAAIALSGCVTPTLPPQPGVPLSPDDPRPARWLAAMAARAEARQSLRGVLRVAVDAADLRYRATQRVAVERPAHLRVEVMGLFGQVAAVLTTDGQDYAFAQAGTPGVQRGPVTEDLLWQVARVDLRPRDAVGLLLGAPAPDPSLVATAAFQAPDGEIQVRLSDARGRARERVAFDSDGRLRGFESWDTGGRPVFEARFEDYGEVAGESFAERVDLRFPRTGAAATMRFRGVELNPDLVPTLFLLTGSERESPGAERTEG